VAPKKSLIQEKRKMKIGGWEKDRQPQVTALIINCGSVDEEDEC